LRSQVPTFGQNVNRGDVLSTYPDLAQAMEDRWARDLGRERKERQDAIVSARWELQQQQAAIAALLSDVAAQNSERSQRSSPLGSAATSHVASSPEEFEHRLISALRGDGAATLAGIAARMDELISMVAGLRMELLHWRRSSPESGARQPEDSRVDALTAQVEELAAVSEALAELPSALGERVRGKLREHESLQDEKLRAALSEFAASFPGDPALAALRETFADISGSLAVQMEDVVQRLDASQERRLDSLTAAIQREVLGQNAELVVAAAPREDNLSEFAASAMQGLDVRLGTATSVVSADCGRGIVPSVADASAEDRLDVARQLKDLVCKELRDFRSTCEGHAQEQVESLRTSLDSLTDAVAKDTGRRFASFRGELEGALGSLADSLPHAIADASRVGLAEALDAQTATLLSRHASPYIGRSACAVDQDSSIQPEERYGDLVHLIGIVVADLEWVRRRGEAALTDSGTPASTEAASVMEPNSTRVSDSGQWLSPRRRSALTMPSELLNSPYNELALTVENALSNLSRLKAEMAELPDPAIVVGGRSGGAAMGNSRAGEKPGG